MVVVCHPESLAAVVNCCQYSSKSPSPVNVSSIKYDGRAARTAPAKAVDVLGAADERGVRETEPPLPNPDPCPPPTPLRGHPLLNPGVDEVILSTKPSLVLLKFNLKFKLTLTVLILQKI